MVIGARISARRSAAVTCNPRRYQNLGISIGHCSFSCHFFRMANEYINDHGKNQSSRHVGIRSTDVRRAWAVLAITISKLLFRNLERGSKRERFM